MTFKNDRATLLCYFTLCASFRSHWWIQTGVTVRKPPIWVKFDDILSRMALEFGKWTWKTIGHLFNATSSFVHHFVAIGEFKLELQSGNNEFGSKSTIFRAVTLRFDVWPWKTIGIFSYATSSFVHHFEAIDKFKLELQSGNAQFRRFLEPCDLQIWWMTFKNNRAPLLCDFKLCASFCSHWWIQTWVTVRKRPIWVKFDDL